MTPADWTPADLIAWRTRMGWTWQQAADGLGLTVQAYGRIEGGKTKRIRRMMVLACLYLETGFSC